ncbi:hypothetical protein BT69DRAFT_1345248 [Atractiella rhizophila]|nr:hypothetical protein BT69DRAFT_1345248 [Atractiella rhizophila]
MSATKRSNTLSLSDEEEEIWSDNNGLDDLGEGYDPYEHLTVLTPTQSPLAAITPHSHLPDSAVVPPSINTTVLRVQTQLRHLSHSEITLVRNADEHTLGISGNVVYLRLVKEVERLRGLNESLQMAILCDSQLPPPAREKPAHIPYFTFDDFKKWRTLFPKLPPREKEKRKYEWLKTKSGAQVTAERIADLKQEAREILEDNTPLYCRKTWSKIPHVHRIHGIAVLECKFPELTQCQGHAMVDHVFRELKHRQLENLNAVDRRAAKQVKVEEQVESVTQGHDGCFREDTTVPGRKEVEKKKVVKLKVKENKGRNVEVFPQLLVMPKSDSVRTDSDISTEGVKGMLKSVLTYSGSVSVWNVKLDIPAPGSPVPSSAVPFIQKTVLPARSFGNAMAVNNVVAASASLHAKANTGGAAVCAPPSVKRIQGGREMYRRSRIEQWEKERADGSNILEPDWKEEYKRLSQSEKQMWNKRYKDLNASLHDHSTTPVLVPSTTEGQL